MEQQEKAIAEAKKKAESKKEEREKQRKERYNEICLLIGKVVMDKSLKQKLLEITKRDAALAKLKVSEAQEAVDMCEREIERLQKLIK
jgi:hypothetical protein